MLGVDDLSENYSILYNNDDEVLEKVIVITSVDPIIKRFCKSLKITFASIWEKRGAEWMKLVRIFSILDTFHLNNIIAIYNENVFLRYHNIDNYLKYVNKNYKPQNVGYFIMAIQHFLQQR